MSDTEKKLTPTEDDNKSGEEKKESGENKSSKKHDISQPLEFDTKKIMEFGLSAHRFGPMQHPLAEKVNEKHIDKILDISEKDAERSFKDAGETRKFTLIYVVIFVILFVFITIFLVGSDKELYKEVIKLFAVFLGGLGSGFGIKSYMDRNK